MKKKASILIATILMGLECTGLINQSQALGAYQDQPVFKISVYKKDASNPDKPVFCDELLVSDMTKNIIITCCKDSRVFYSLFSAPITERKVKFARGSVITQKTVFCLSKDPLGMALIRYQYSKSENRYVKVRRSCFQQEESQQHLNDDGVTFTKADFILKVTKVPPKVLV